MSASAWSRTSPPPPASPARAGRRFAAYGALALVAARQSFGERTVIAGRVLFHAVVLAIFAALWDAALAGGLALGSLSRADLVWYLALTEWVVLTVPMLHLELERDVRSGDIAYRLTRPVPYLGARIAEAAGEWAARALVLAFAGTAFAYAFAGGWPSDPRGLAFALPLGVLSVQVTLLFLTAIGLLAFWLQDCSPAYWLWQKTLFVFGGLLLPLEIYPDWLRALAVWTPFAPMLHGVGRLAFGFEPGAALAVALQLVAWAVVLVVAVRWLERRALRALDVNGG